MIRTVSLLPTFSRHPSPEINRRHPRLPLEELPEGRLVGEVEHSRNLLYSQFRMRQQVSGFAEKHFEDKVTYALPRHEFHYLSEVMGRKVQPRSIEIYLVLFAIMDSQQLDERLDDAFVAGQRTIGMCQAGAFEDIAQVEVEGEQAVQNDLLVIEMLRAVDVPVDADEAFGQQLGVRTLQGHHRLIIEPDAVLRPPVNHIRRIHLIHKVLADKEATAPEIITASIQPKQMGRRQQQERICLNVIRFIIYHRKPFS